MGIGNLKMVSALWAHDPLPIDDELVAFSFAAENWMVIENQAIELWAAVLLEKQSRGKTAYPSTDDYTIEHLACVNGVWRQRIEGSIADLMSRR